MRKLILAAAAAVAFAASPAFADGTAEDICYGLFEVNEAERNYPEALRHCREAASQGKARAQYLLGYMLENGKGTAARGLRLIPPGRLSGTGKRPIRDIPPRSMRSASLTLREPR